MNKTKTIIDVEQVESFSNGQMTLNARLCEHQLGDILVYLLFCTSQILHLPSNKFRIVGFLKPIDHFIEVSSDFCHVTKLRLCGQRDHDEPLTPMRSSISFMSSTNTETSLRLPCIKVINLRLRNA